jgi:hypothetical protein
MDWTKRPIEEILGPRTLPAPELEFVRTMPGRPDVPMPRGIDMGDLSRPGPTGFGDNGPGIAVKDTLHTHLFFSERNKFGGPSVHIGRLFIKILTPRK